MEWKIIEYETARGERPMAEQSAIARFEAGNINPSLGFLEKMAEVMGYKINISLSK